MGKKRLKLFGKWSFLAWLVIGYVGFVVVVDLLRRVDWIRTNINNPVAVSVWTWLKSPAGIVVLLIGAVVWLTVLGFSSVGDDDERTVQTSTAISELEPAPNIVVLRTDVVPVSLTSDGSAHFSPVGPDVAAVVQFRNDAVRGRDIGVSIQTRAHVELTAGGEVMHFDGHWLDEGTNRVDFMVGDSRTLVLAVLVRNDTLFLDDTREAYAGRIIVRRFLRAEAGVKVKLVGGLSGTHVAEFEFSLRCSPDLAIRQSR